MTESQLAREQGCMRERWVNEQPPLIPKGRTVRAKLRRLQREHLSGTGWSVEEWTALLEKHANRCLRCKSNGPLVPDHVIPMFRGGAHSIDNIQPLCNKCNIIKGLKVVDYR